MASNYEEHLHEHEDDHDHDHDHDHEELKDQELEQDDYENYEDDFEPIAGGGSHTVLRSECDLTQNKTFSRYRIHEIEQTNAILMKKVLAHSNRPRKVEQPPQKVRTSAEINRRKQQRKIDHDNLILLKKIQSIKPFGLSKNKSYL